MPTTIKKKTKKIAEDPLSSSGVSSLSGISSYNIRKISIYKNGDRFHRGVKFVINPRVIKDMEPLLNQINDRIELSHGAKKLYSADGKMVASIKELEDGKIYVAASGHFIPMRYGEFTERVWKPPSRKHSPIMSADRIKTARTRSQEPGKRRQQQQQLTAEGSQIGSGVQRSRSVRTLAEDRKSRRDVSRGNSSVKTNGVAPPPIPKRPEMVRPKVGAKVERKPIPTNKKPPTPKRGVNKKVLGAAMGAGVAVVGAAAIGATMIKKPKTPAKPIATAVSDISTASSVIPAPNIESNAAEILEFPEEEKKVDMATIHRTPTPPRTPTAPMSRSSSAKSAKSLARKPSTPGEKAAMVMEAKSISQQPTPESSEEEEEEEEEEDDEEESVEDDEEEEGSEQEEEEAEDEEEEDEEEEEEEEGSGVETPASRRSSSAVSSARSAPKSAKSTRSGKSSAK